MKLVQVFSAVISVLGTFAYVLWPILVLLALVMWVAQLGWDWVR